MTFHRWAQHPKSGTGAACGTGWLWIARAPLKLERNVAALVGVRVVTNYTTTSYPHRGLPTAYISCLLR